MRNPEASWSLGEQYPERLTSVCLAATALILAAVIAAHAGLIPMSRWQGDEYAILARFKQEGVSLFAERVLDWSPRPVSEAILYLY